jgi:polar amino acid transport system substrate-binding protein
MIEKLFAVSLFAVVLIFSAGAARADEGKPCEPDKVATRYPELAGKTIRIGQDGTSLPFSYRDPANPERIIGSDADLARAVFGCIGVPVEFVIGQWAGLLPAVAGGRIDVMWDVLYYTPKRAEMVDFVLYSTMADGALVHKGNPTGAHSLDDLCGKRALAGLGTIEIVLLGELTTKCTGAGKPAIDITTYTDRPSAWQMIETNRADVMLTSLLGGRAIAAEKPDLLEVSFSFEPDIKVGVAVAKGRTELEHALADAISALQANGEMAKIYQQYKLETSWILSPGILTK